MLVLRIQIILPEWSTWKMIIDPQEIQLDIAHYERHPISQVDGAASRCRISCIFLGQRATLHSTSQNTAVGVANETANLWSLRDAWNWKLQRSLGCLSLFPYFVVIYAVNHLGFVYNHFGIGMTGLLCLFCLIVLFCGGFLINFMAVSNVFISRMHEKVVCPCVCVSSICWLFLFSSIFALSTSDESPIHQYWQLSQSPMRGLGICDTNEWKDSTRGLYFRNGAISRNGMLFDTFQVNVHKCTRLNTKGPWNACSFRVRPYRASSRLHRCHRLHMGNLCMGHCSSRWTRLMDQSKRNCCYSGSP